MENGQAMVRGAHAQRHAAQEADTMKGNATAQAHSMEVKIALGTIVNLRTAIQLFVQVRLSQNDKLMVCSF